MGNRVNNEASCINDYLSDYISKQSAILFNPVDRQTKPGREVHRERARQLLKQCAMGIETKERHWENVNWENCNPLSRHAFHFMPNISHLLTKHPDLLRIRTCSLSLSLSIYVYIYICDYVDETSNETEIYSNNRKPAKMSPCLQLGLGSTFIATFFAFYLIYPH